MPPTKAWGATPAKNSRPTAPGPSAEESTGVSHHNAGTVEAVTASLSAALDYLWLVLAAVAVFAAIVLPGILR